MYYSLMKENRSETGRKSIGVLALVCIDKAMYVRIFTTVSFSVESFLDGQLTLRDAQNISSNFKT